MNWLDITTLFLAMAALAAVPSTSVMLVITRSATGGVRRGICVAVGIVLGDLVFLAIALLGLVSLAEAMEGVFRMVRYIGAAYLIWLGLTLLRSQSATAETGETAENAGVLGDLLAGLVLTLGDIKAIFFYASLLPGFIPPGELSLASVAPLVAVTVVAVGGVKTLYAMLAGPLASRVTHPRLRDFANRLGGGVLLAAGGYIMAS